MGTDDTSEVGPCGLPGRLDPRPSVHRLEAVSVSGIGRRALLGSAFGPVGRVFINWAFGAEGTFARDWGGSEDAGTVAMLEF